MKQSWIWITNGPQKQHLQMAASDAVRSFPPSPRCVEGRRGWARREGWKVERPREVRAIKCYSWSQRQKPIRKLLLSVGKGPGDMFPACVPSLPAPRHRRDNEILILSDRGPPGQDHVTWYFNDHNPGNTVWLWRRNFSPSPSPKGAQVTGRNRKWGSETEHGTPCMFHGPLSTQDRKAVTTFHCVPHQC